MPTALELRYTFLKTTPAQAILGFSYGWLAPALKVEWSPRLMPNGEHAISTQQCPWSTLIYQACL